MNIQKNKPLQKKSSLINLSGAKLSQGFSLVELMVAMVVGLLIITGAFSLHSTTRRIQVKNEEQMDLVADARFAIEMIAYDLHQAGLWGGTNRDGLIGCKSSDAPCVPTAAGDTPPSAIANDCSVGWYYNLAQPIFATDNSNPYGTTCIDNTTEGYVIGSDVLEVRYADPNLPVALLDNQAYVRSNFLNGRVFVGDTPPILKGYEDSPLTANHELHAYAYYVSDFTDEVGDDIPSLRRVALVNAPSLENQVLISGVVDLQVLFGVDTDNDQIVNHYEQPSVITTANNWANVYSAKIWLLMRTDTRQPGMNTAKTFTIPGSFNLNGVPTTAFGGQDGFRYFMMSSVVDLKNLKQL